MFTPHLMKTVGSCVTVRMDKYAGRRKKHEFNSHSTHLYKECSNIPIHDFEVMLYGRIEVENANTRLYGNVCHSTCIHFKFIRSSC
jgi:hypothetical protein